MILTKEELIKLQTFFMSGVEAIKHTQTSLNLSDDAIMSISLGDLMNTYDSISYLIEDCLELHELVDLESANSSVN